jgi:hypothetical protein
MGFHITRHEAHSRAAVFPKSDTSSVTHTYTLRCPYKMTSTTFGGYGPTSNFNSKVTLTATLAPVVHICLFDCLISGAAQIDGITSVSVQFNAPSCSTETDPITGAVLPSSGGVNVQLQATAQFRVLAWGIIWYDSSDSSVIRSSVYDIVTRTTPKLVAGPFCVNLNKILSGLYQLAASMPVNAFERAVLRLGSVVSHRVVYCLYVSVLSMMCESVNYVLCVR